MLNDKIVKIYEEKFTYLKYLNIKYILNLTI